MTDATRKIQTYVRDQTIEWDPGIVEKLKRHGLTDQTIDILGQEEYITMQLISYMDKDAINEVKEKYGLPIAQVTCIKHLVNSCQEYGEVKSDTMYKCQVVAEKENIIDYKKITPKQKDMLVTHAPELCNIVWPFRVFVVLRALKCFTEHDMEHCLTIPSRYKQVYEMITIIERATYKHYWSLVRALRSTGQKHAAKLLYHGQLEPWTVSITSKRSSKNNI